MMKGNEDKPMLKVLISYLFCSRGGVETALLNRLRTVDRTRYAVDLHFFRDYGGRGMFRDFKGRIYIEAREKAVCALLKKKQYDLVITIDSPSILKLLKQAGYGGKIGLEVHTTYAEGIRYLNDKQMEMLDFLIVPSAYQKTLVRKKIPQKKIYVLGNAVNHEIGYEAQCALKLGKKILLWIGRIDEHKNWRLFLQIAEYLNRGTDSYLFWIVGGLKSEPKDIQEFIKYLYLKNLQRYVRWIPQVEYKNMGILYSYAANSGGCYISTSKNESFGMTVIEAMKCRCPVVVNSVGALRELVGSTRGLCVEHMEKVEQMERIREFLCENKEETVNLAQEYVQAEFSGEAIAAKFCSILYKEIPTQVNL